MRRLACLVKGHVPVAVRTVDVMMVPTVGLQVMYEEAADGDHLACQRCRRIL